MFSFQRVSFAVSCAKLVSTSAQKFVCDVEVLEARN